MNEDKTVLYTCISLKSLSFTRRSTCTCLYHDKWR